MFVYLAFRDVDFQALGQALTSYEYVYLAPAGAALVLGVSAPGVALVAALRAPRQAGPPARHQGPPDRLPVQHDPSPALPLIVLVATNLILILPSSPAARGAFEAAAVLALSAYGVDREDALSFALVLHALNAFPYPPLGYAALVAHSRAMNDR